VIASGYSIVSRSISGEAHYYSDTLPEIAALFMTGYDIIDTIKYAAECHSLRNHIKEAMLDLRVRHLRERHLEHYNDSFKRPPLDCSSESWKVNFWKDPFIKEIIVDSWAFIALLGLLGWQFSCIKLVHENNDSANIQLTVADIAAMVIVIGSFLWKKYSGIKTQQAECLADLDAVDITLTSTQNPNIIANFINNHMPRDVKDTIVSQLQAGPSLPPITILNEAPLLETTVPSSEVVEAAAIDE
jgi:hypothetical protein